MSNGKGDKPREVNKKAFSKNWDKVFKKTSKVSILKPSLLDEDQIDLSAITEETNKNES